MSEKVIIGRFGTPHGVRGDIRVHSFTDPLANILNYQPWSVDVHGEQRTITITKHRQHNEQLLVHIEGFDDRDEVRLFTNANIETTRESLPELSHDEHYWHDLIGLKVLNTDNQELGTIDHLFATGSNDVIVALKDKKECYIPYLDGVVLEINQEDGIMRVDWEPLE